MYYISWVFLRIQHTQRTVEKDIRPCVLILVCIYPQPAQYHFFKYSSLEVPRIVSEKTPTLENLHVQFKYSDA